MNLIALLPWHPFGDSPGVALAMARCHWLRPRHFLCQLCSTEGWLCWALSDKGTCFTPVTLIVHCRSQRHAPGLWAVTAMTIWTLWVPSFCKARRANCTFKVGCPWKLGTRERRGEGDTGDSEEARCGGRMEKKKKDRETDKNEEYGNEDRIWCLFKILTYTGH